MPALTRLRVVALEELAEGQRFTPARTVARQIDRIERVALEIDPDAMYAEDWIIRRITGFPARIDDPRQIVGAALLADLSALAERLSDRAALPADADTGAIGIEGLAELWSVSRKTIDRYRRSGLIGRRVRDATGVVRIVFSPAAVRGFAQMRGPRIDRAGAFSRLSDAERARAVRWAAEYRRRLGWTVSQAAARIAVRLGRSHGAVRTALDATADLALTTRGVSPERDGELAERALRWGVPTAAIAERIGRSRASVHRLVLDRRAARVRALNLATPMDDRMDASAAEAALAPPAIAESLSAPPWRTAADAVTAARANEPIEADLERARAAAYHALRWTVARDRSSAARAAAVDRWTVHLLWASMLKRSLIAAEIGLIVRTAEGILGGPLESVGDARSIRVVRGGLAIIGAVVDGFDPSRGGRVAGAAALPITRWLASEVAAGKGVRPAPARKRDGVALGAWDRAITPWDAWTREPAYVTRWWQSVDADVRPALELHFGLSGQRPVEIGELGRRVGCSARGAGARVGRGIIACRRIAASARE